MRCDASETAGLVVRLTPGGKFDTSVHGNARLPLSFADLRWPPPRYDPSSRLAMTSAWISLVPSKMRNSRPSRQKRWAGNSCE
jgi:hypothetical protein